MRDWNMLGSDIGEKTSMDVKSGGGVCNYCKNDRCRISDALLPAKDHPRPRHRYLHPNGAACCWGHPTIAS